MPRTRGSRENACVFLILPKDRNCCVLYPSCCLEINACTCALYSSMYRVIGSTYTATTFYCTAINIHYFVGFSAIKFQGAAWKPRFIIPTHYRWRGACVLANSTSANPQIGELFNKAHAPNNHILHKGPFSSLANSLFSEILIGRP